jgi:hypothetical protein
MIDVIEHGIIIGEISCRIELVAPNGRVQKTGQLFPGESEIAWGKNALEEIKSSKCGDGKPLFHHRDIFHGIYGKGQWKVRVYEG